MNDDARPPDPLPVELLATDDQRRTSDREIDDLLAEIRAAERERREESAR